MTSHYNEKSNNYNNNEPRREPKPKQPRKTKWQIEAEEAALEMNIRNDIQAILQRIGGNKDPDYVVKVANEFYAQAMRNKHGDDNPEDETSEQREDFVDEYKSRNPGNRW